MSTSLPDLRHLSPRCILFLCVLIDMLGYSIIVPLLPFMTCERSDRFGWAPLDNEPFFTFIGLWGMISQGLLIGQLQPQMGEPLVAVAGRRQRPVERQPHRPQRCGDRAQRSPAGPGVPASVGYGSL